MRPQLKPGLRRVWRDRRTVQIGLDPEHALVLTDLDPALTEVVDGLTGIRTTEAIVTQALSRGIDGVRARRLLQLLSDGGVLDDAESTHLALRDLTPTERERLSPDLAARSVSSRSPDGGAAELAVRRDACVAVYGAGRVGASMTSLLASAGVGRLTIIDRSLVRPADLAPAGLALGDVGSSRALGASRAVAGSAPSTDVAAIGEGQTTVRPHVAILAPDDEPDRRVADTLVRAGVPHLVVRMREARAILGPFVLPGESSCIRCHDLHRAARDPQWPHVLAQVLSEPTRTPACDVVLATSLAAQATLHVLAFLNGVRPPSVDATLEMDLPLGAQRRRSWSSHPSCGCQWDPEPLPAAAA
ncbi:ThiF family adenylyltransferase [Actinopolymorpha alba]|uniref:ThiF family adenylyltransferase n=1 Tax=Actinopolymorpha alba TaxID=533267 RepID=UPI000399A181|nr:ThiF family adenylyltransferase [Actinopolymorpha alba]